MLNDPALLADARFILDAVIQPATRESIARIVADEKFCDGIRRDLKRCARAPRVMLGVLRRDRCFSFAMATGYDKRAIAAVLLSDAGLPVY